MCESLFPGFAEDSREQAALSACQSGVGCKRSVDVARLAHLGALIAAKPQKRDIIRDAINAGLVVASPLLARLDVVVDDATAALLETLEHTSTCSKQPGPRTENGNELYKGITAGQSLVQRSQTCSMLTLPTKMMAVVRKSRTSMHEEDV